MPTGPATPIIVISLGDPLGIGPEVTVKALHARRVAGAGGPWAYVVLGADGPMRAAAEAAGIAPYWNTIASWPARAAPGAVTLLDLGTAPARALGGPPRATPEGGELSFRWVDEGITACLDDRAVALVTAPINKEAWSLAGRDYPGHTELLAERCRSRTGPSHGARMMFVAPKLMTMLVTTHQSLASVSAAITEARVFDTIALAHESCRRLGVARPRVAVCGVNPHASEGGLFGDEEARAVTPAIRRARGAGIDADGPFPGDTVFGAALRGRFDIVVAMYHDQGLIPVKLLAFDRAVNVTVGLPITRTSPDHGTAYDIAGTNQADPGSMLAAIDLAERLAESEPE